MKLALFITTSLCLYYYFLLKRYERIIEQYQQNQAPIEADFLEADLVEKQRVREYDAFKVISAADPEAWETVEQNNKKRMPTNRQKRNDIEFEIN